ncbi:MAG: hypothetical protein N838_35275 [Thiohalocapsa sp. PB-PSB1]|nr:MAG: hypothetical protein N838_35275 [Thiohalocapsa sp. PB-PSB1]
MVAVDLESILGASPFQVVMEAAGQASVAAAAAGATGRKARGRKGTVPVILM